MKKCLLFVFNFLSIALFAQVRTTTDLSLVKEIPVKQFIGKKFRASVDIKNKPTDTSGSAALFILQVGKSEWDFIPNTAQNVPASKRDTSWHHYQANGTIKNETHKLWLYVNTKGNGDFYYDNFDLEVEEEPNKWIKISIPNANFEESSNPLKAFKGTEKLKSMPGVKVALVKNPDQRFQQTLHINATGSKSYYLYGHNTAKGSYFKSNATKIYYETYGEGEPLLLLHGNGGSISAFKEQIPVLAQHYRVIGVDTRGQGKSLDKTSDQFSYDQFAEDMKTLLDTLGLKQVNVVGWSDGGNTGLILAMKHPTYVKKLVTMGANLNPEETSVSPKILKQTRDDLKKLQALNNERNRTDILLLAMLLKEPHISPGDLQKVLAKTLIMAGEKDVILAAHTKLIAQSIPNAELTILKGETHFVPQENPTLFNRTVLDFLAKP